MIKSLRFRILAWYALSLLLTVGCFGGFLYWRLRESRLSEMDLELRGAGQTLLAALKGFPDYDFQGTHLLGTPPDFREFSPPGPPRGGDRRGGRGFGGRGGGPGMGFPPGFGGPSRGGPNNGRPNRVGPVRNEQGRNEPSRNEPSFGPRPAPPGGQNANGQNANGKDANGQDAGAPRRRRPELESEASRGAAQDPDEAPKPPPAAEGPRDFGPPRGGPRERGGRGGPGSGPGGGGMPFGPGPDFGGRGPGDFGFRGGPPPEFLEELAKRAENLALPTDFERRIEAYEGEKPFFVIWRKNGAAMKATDRLVPQGLQDAKVVRPTPEGVIRSHGDYRELWIAGPHESTLLVRRKAAKLHEDLAQQLWAILGAGAAVLLFGLAGGWWMSYGVLNSVRAMNREIAALSEKNLYQRIGLRGVDAELSVLAKTLNRALARLESAFDRQRQFTGDASHELRTPLTIVMGNLELALRDASLGAESKRSLEAALRAARRMRELTDQLLLLARADAGALELKRSEFDLGDIVQECAELVRPMADKKQVHLEVDAPSTEIEGDAGLLSQVVINLLSNAIQYNKTGGAVHIGLHDSGDAVQLQVSDTGVGIPEEARARLFERFYRPDGSRNRQSGGTGLGLAISKSLVEAHGGQITFDSAEGAGTEFRVFLPRC